jgi:hypothetical protein
LRIAHLAQERGGGGVGLLEVVFYFGRVCDVPSALSSEPVLFKLIRVVGDFWLYFAYLERFRYFSVRRRMRRATITEAMMYQ